MIPGYPEFNGNHESENAEKLLRERTIRASHRQLVRAELKDLVLEHGQASDTQRHAVEGSPIQDRHMTGKAIDLKPNAFDHTHPIKRLTLRFPIVSWDLAGKKLQDQYMTALRLTAPKLMERYVSPEAIMVPTNDVFGEAFDQSGNSVTFLLTPEGLLPTGEGGTVEEAPLEARLDGQFFTASPTAATSLAQAELDTWFTVEQLASIMHTHEPVPFDRGSSTTTAA